LHSEGRANPDQVEAIRQQVAGVHAVYLQAFDQFVQRAREQGDS
jgi:hypothetical protein